MNRYVVTLRVAATLGQYDAYAYFYDPRELSDAEMREQAKVFCLDGVVSIKEVHRAP